MRCDAAVIEAMSALYEQVDLAAVILQLAKRAPITAIQIHARQISAEDWQQMAGLSVAVVEQAALQTQTVEFPHTQDGGRD